MAAARFVDVAGGAVAFLAIAFFAVAFLAVAFLAVGWFAVDVAARFLVGGISPSVR